jgi:hypothetical protein
MTEATVKQMPDGQLILDDPAAIGVFRAVSKHNCKLTLDANADRVAHFRERAKTLGYGPDQVVIVVINVDAMYGAELAEGLMPGHDWQSYRDRDEVPIARGLAAISGIHEFLLMVDRDASDKLSNFDGLAVIVVDHGVAEIF